MSGPFAQNLLEAFPLGLAVLDSEGRIVQVNAEAARRLDERPENLIGTDFFEAIVSTHSFDNARNVFLARAIARRVSLELEAVGTRVHLRGLETEQGYGVVTVFEPSNDDGRHREIAAAWEAAIQLASEIRHAINNPLMVIMGQVENLQMRGDLPAVVRQRLSEMHHEALRIRDLVSRLQEIGRK